jgi:hypothetical protein
MCVFVPLGVNRTGSGQHKQLHQYQKQKQKQTVTKDSLRSQHLALNGQKFNKTKRVFFFLRLLFASVMKDEH